MKAYIVRKWHGDHYGHGDYHYLGVCLTEEAAYKVAEANQAQVEETDLLDVGFLPPQERAS